MQPHWSVSFAKYIKMIIIGVILSYFLLPIQYVYSNNENWNAIHFHETEGLSLIYFLIILVIILEFTTPWSRRKWGLRFVVACITALISFFVYLNYTIVSPEYIEPTISRQFFQLDYGLYILFSLFPLLFTYYITSSISYYKTKSS